MKLKQLDSHPVVNVFANIFFATIIPTLVVGCVMMACLGFQVIFDSELPGFLFKTGIIVLMVEIMIALLLGITTLIFHRD